MPAHRSTHGANTHAVREIDLTADELIAALLRLAPERRLSLLDSGAPSPHTPRRDSRYLIAGFDPFEIIEAHAASAPDLLTRLDEKLHTLRQSHTESGAPSLILPGACIATLAYDLVHGLERLHTTTLHDANGDDEPDAVLAFYQTLVIHDYAQKITYINSCADARQAELVGDELVTLAADAKRGKSRHARASRSQVSAISNFTRDAYIAAVLRIQEHIVRGDIYQANLTQQITCTLAPEDEPEDIFLRLRGSHPAPFGAFIRRRSDTIVSISPERFLRVRHGSGGRLIEAAPIKGTRPRGADSVEDAQLRAELAASVKDRAENVMIVDLMRNDLGRVCQYGSVTVSELCRVEEHPTLFHLVSTVEGILRDDVTIGDLLRAAFPCGSITGAPKIRAMEILDDIETAPRKLSMGSIGYFGFDGSLDLSVAIRTMTIHNRTARFNVGGGIVIDSQPADEYDESLTKARALLAALNANFDNP